MISTKYLFFVQTFLVATVMTFIMSFAISAMNLGFVSGFMHIWLQAWGAAFIIAFPTLTVVFPTLRALAMRIASKNDSYDE
ncbi:MAG: DUF2798 domain-containing protein [Sulfuricurvum sp.]|jgi:uncharacterized membrane protein YjjB (DUF3815 family)|uniref:DUF2798 domain-containing protein n=1 Tax=Sulfuricurvum sp. TaxID=2025608 RepID=UPI002612CCFD|nr:DUF2798 domain-containing protein [Sulfuricurvum sp.]MDD3598010.1 DUF2798 domain-containing protein [Sulfuricurvum sp.]MDD4884058.1 DUF2798 domain-containing protein [Sulfuricurvum sp.]